MNKPRAEHIAWALATVGQALAEDSRTRRNDRHDGISQGQELV